MSLIEFILVLVLALLTLAYVTEVEGGIKPLASTLRRLGQTAIQIAICCWGLFQPLAVILKLLLKCFVAPRQANMVLFLLGPEIAILVLFSLF